MLANLLGAALPAAVRPVLELARDAGEVGPPLPPPPLQAVLDRAADAAGLDPLALYALAWVQGRYGDFWTVPGNADAVAAGLARLQSSRGWCGGLRAYMEHAAAVPGAAAELAGQVAGLYLLFFARGLDPAGFSRLQGGTDAR